MSIEPATYPCCEHCDQDNYPHDTPHPVPCLPCLGIMPDPEPEPGDETIG